MGTELLHLGVVTFSLLLLMVIPFVPITFLLFRGQQWPKMIFSAMVLGFSMQASIGMLWSHVPDVQPLAETAVLATAWLVLLVWAFRGAARRSIVIWDIDAEPIHPGLIIILLLGFVIRSIHPLEVSYLGQSDAYTHLNYARNIIEYGFLANPSYPPGFHWILALPSLVFSIDPYYTARFGGAIFGTGMVLGIYVLLEQCVDRRTALFGSFCAAAFPGMFLLMKTGVGSFANQFGLMLLPAVFLFYILAVSVRSSSSSDTLLLSLSLLGLAAAVPMMLLHTLLVIGLERLVMLVRNRRQWLTKTFHVVILLLPALLLFTFHINQLGGGQRFETAEMMTRYNLDKTSTVKKITDPAEKQIATLKLKIKNRSVADFLSKSPYLDLLTDYFSIKRKGFGNLKLNALAGTLVFSFFILFSIGLVREDSIYVVLGLWGLMTCIQASTGFLQFSAYQREGWSLLIATCCLSGIIASYVYRFVEHIRLFGLTVIMIMAASFAWSVVHPPFHFPLWSSAENELVKSIRFLGKNPWAWSIECEDRITDALCDIVSLLKDDLEVTLVTRRFVGWGNQGEIALNVMPPDSTVSALIVDNKAKNDIFQKGRQYVALVDQRNSLSGKQVIGAFAMVTPFMVEATLKSRERMFGINKEIVRQVDNLDNSSWNVTCVQISDVLSAYVVVPSS